MLCLWVHFATCYARHYASLLLGACLSCLWFWCYIESILKKEHLITLRFNSKIFRIVTLAILMITIIMVNKVRNFANTFPSDFDKKKDEGRGKMQLLESFVTQKLCFTCAP